MSGITSGQETFTLYVENDGTFVKPVYRTDRHYTNGVKLVYTHQPDCNFLKEFARWNGFGQNDGQVDSTGSTSSPQAGSGQGQGVIEIARKMLGATFGYEAVSGTIRGDLGCSRGFNLVHGSDSAQSAAYEIPLFFKSEELIEYEFADEHWLYGKNE
jgi:hypothetical protein